MKVEYVEKMLRGHLIVTGLEEMLIDYLIDDKSLTLEEYINYGLKDE